MPDIALPPGGTGQGLSRVGAEPLPQVSGAIADVRQAVNAAATKAQWLLAQRVVALVTVAVLGLRITVVDSLNVTAGFVLAAVLAPLWIRVLREYRGAKLLLWSGVATVVSGAVLTQLNSTDHQTSTKHLIANSVVVLSVVLGFAVILWARTLLKNGMVATAFGVGMVLGISSTSTLYSANPWRFGFSVPITVLVLGLAALLRKRWLELLAVVMLMLVSAVSDARSSSAILFLTALFVCWQMLPRNSSKRGSAIRIVLVVAVLAATVYNLGQSLILSGALGEETQERSQTQVDTSGSLILGGRPELAATAALMAHSPAGFGSGTLPSHVDLNVAKAGMAGINYDPDNGYVERFMFGSGYELHSTAGDLWANFGIVGLLFALVVLVVSLRGFGDAMARRSASGIVLFLTVKMLWNIPFSPLQSSVPLLMLLLGLVLVRKSGDTMRAVDHEDSGSEPDAGLSPSLAVRVHSSGRAPLRLNRT